MDLSEANKIIRKRQQTIPVPVVTLAGDLGATAYTASNWPDDKSGMIRANTNRDGKRSYEIYVNASHHYHRQRFTIAHEIAHIVLHDHLIGDGITTDGLYRSGLPNAIEWAANRFAGNILIPKEKLVELITEGKTSVVELAHEFQVSRSAMAIQLDWPWAYGMN